MSDPPPFQYNYPVINPPLTEMDLNNQSHYMYQDQLQGRSNNGLYHAQFQPSSSSNAIGGLVILQQEQGGGGGCVPWNGKMSSLGPQAQQDQIPVLSFEQLQSMWTSEVSSQVQQPYYGPISQPPIPHCGPQSQDDFSFYPLQQSYHNLSLQPPAPTIPRASSTSNGVENDSTIAPPALLPQKLKKVRPKSQPERPSIPPPPASSVSKWKGKKVVSNASEPTAVLSSSLSPLDVPAGSNKRKRDEGPLEGSHKRANPVPKPIPLPRVPMTRDIDCPKLYGTQDCCCEGCLSRKADRLSRMNHVTSYITQLCSQGISITQEVEVEIPIPDLGIRSVWSLKELVPLIGFEGVFHPANCFVFDQVTGCRYWWPNYNRIGPGKWPARFLAIPCPPELVLHWSVINLIRVYQAGFNVSFDVIVAYYKNLGNIPADIPPHRRLSFQQPILDNVMKANDVYHTGLEIGHVAQLNNNNTNNRVSVPDCDFLPQTVQSEPSEMIAPPLEVDVNEHLELIVTEPTEHTTDIVTSQPSFDYGNISATEPTFPLDDRNEGTTSAGILITPFNDNFQENSTLDPTQPDDVIWSDSAIAYLVDTLSDVLYSSQSMSS